MKSRSIPVAVAAALAAWILSSVVAGCGKTFGIQPLFHNSRPSVTLTAAPVNTADTAWYSYDIHWSGYDADGRVVRYDYAIDAPTTPNADTAWVTTTKSHEQFFFRSTEPYYDPVHGWRSSGYHTFAIRAVDDAGASSSVVSRAFYSYTIAPTVQVTKPVPNKFISRPVPTDLTVHWEGHDDDGVASDRPVLYRYRLFRPADTEFDFALAHSLPDSLRSFYAARNFAGWDSVGADTTWIRYPSLAPDQPYLFVVVAIDEAGAYSPQFSLETNMLDFTPTTSGLAVPGFTIWSDYFRISGTDPGPLEAEIPAGTPVTVHWFATATGGGTIAGYAWQLDGTPPVAATDTTTRCTLGPFAGAEEHFLYLLATDDLGVSSLVTVRLRVVALTMEHELLVVDDTRLPVDQYPNGMNSAPQAYGDVWPAAAELDTFFYAKGGFPWRGPQGLTGNLPLSRPGVFAGYGYDTLGTRLGYEIASAGVPLALLAHYRHVLWLTDLRGLTTSMGAASVIDPISYLRWMSGPDRLSTLATYVAMGGEVWLAGGTAASCTLLPWNATGSANNDTRYGPGHLVFSADAGELAPGRLMWDAAHWRSEMAASHVFTVPTRSAAALGGWSSPGWNFAHPVSAPGYSALPPALRRRALALGDSLPPTCLGNTTRYYTTALPLPVEYLTEDNRIVEDFDPDPLVVESHSALDSLYELQGGNLVTLQTGRRPVAMTYYYGTESPRFVFTGFDLWSWSRQDVVGLVDFVLHDVWGMNRAAPRPAIPAARAPGAPAPPAARRALLAGPDRAGSRR